MTLDKLLYPLMLGACLFAAQPAAAGKEVKFDFATEKVGAEPASFVPTVGNWVVGFVSEDKGHRIRVLDKDAR